MGVSKRLIRGSCPNKEVQVRGSNFIVVGHEDHARKRSKLDFYPINYIRKDLVTKFVNGSKVKPRLRTFH